MNENVIRSLSGIVYISVLILATLYSIESFFILFGVFLILTAKEFARLIHLPQIPALIASIIVYFQFAVFGSNYLIELSLVVLTILLLIQLVFWLFSKNNTSLKQSNWLLLTGYIIFPFVFLTKLPIVNNQFIPSIIIGIFILIWTNDTFAYIVGKSIGKNKLFERISPKKTIEGFIGGVFFAIIASIIIANYVVEMSMISWIISAFMISVFGTIGDLVESKFKRIANVKDSGNIMPGHGGMLDRLDSIIFVAPFLFLFYKIIVYVS